MKIAPLNLFLFAAVVPIQALAQLINFDLTANGFDDFGPGSAIYGSSTSQWNTFQRTTDPAGSPISLFDDAGNLTSVTVTWNRVASGGLVSTGAYADLGNSVTAVQDLSGDGLLRFSGLDSNAIYDLVLFYHDVSLTTPIYSDWSTLVEGQNYMESQGLNSDSTGALAFSGFTEKWWNGIHCDSAAVACGSFTGFQLQSSSVSEPSIFALIGAGLVGLGFARRRQQQA